MLKQGLCAIADLLMPRVCLCCGAVLDQNEKHICGKCLKDLPQTRYWKLRENPMAESFNALIQKNMGDNTSYRPYGHAAALYFYKGGFKEISKALKYRRNFAAGRYFAKMLGSTLAESQYFKDIDLVVPIPLHWTRRWRRGYNQAEIIAKEVAARLKCPCDMRLLKRSRHTRTQTHLNLEGRALNVTGAFRVGKIQNMPRHVLLIDDVFTTGATAAACESAIHQVLPTKTRVSIATLACVEH